MKAVLAANPKGGAGKTTLATNLAAAFATRDDKVVLWDLDRQQSSLNWLSIRPGDRPRIDRLDATGGNERAVRNADWLILDSAAGLHGRNLEHALNLSHKVVVPVQPSVFDMAATSSFLRRCCWRRSRCANIATRSASWACAWTGELAPHRLSRHFWTYLRDTQVYVNAAFNGLGVFDLPEYVSRRDVEEWQPLLEWVGGD